jgi:NADH-quinone oxidoreductase subunit J
MQLFVFVCAAVMVLGGGLGVVLRPHPVHAALSLVLTLFGIAVLFIAQDAQFLAAVQVIVYAGAIVVLFLFVIMLLGIDRSDNLRTEPFRIQRPVAVVTGLALAGLLVTAVAASRDSAPSGTTAPSTGHDDNVRAIARSLFSDYVLAFELTSVLLVIAVVGTVVLARRPKRGDLAAPDMGVERDAAEAAHVTERS